MRIILLASALVVASACSGSSGEDSASSASDFSAPRDRGPGNGRRPISPVLAPEEDAAAPVAQLVLELDAAVLAPPAPPADDAGADASAPVMTDDDAGSP